MSVGVRMSVFVVIVLHQHDNESVEIEQCEVFSTEREAEKFAKGNRGVVYEKTVRE